MRQKFWIEKYDWEVVAFYEPTDRDIIPLLNLLEKSGCDDRKLSECRKLIFGKKKNVGFTFTNKMERKSIMVICNSDSPEEFNNTLVHECKHIERHIEKTFRIDPYGEEAAYLSGCIAEHTFHATREYLCNCKS